MEVTDFINDVVRDTGTNSKTEDCVEREYIDNIPTITVFRSVGIYYGKQADKEDGVCFITNAKPTESKERVIASGIIEFLKNMILSYIGYEFVEFAESTAESLDINSIEEFIKKDSYRDWVIKNGGDPDEYHSVVFVIKVEGKPFSMIEDVIDDNDTLIADSGATMRVSAIFAHKDQSGKIIFMS